MQNQPAVPDISEHLIPDFDYFAVEPEKEDIHLEGRSFLSRRRSNSRVRAMASRIPSSKVDEVATCRWATLTSQPRSVLHHRIRPSS